MKNNPYKKVRFTWSRNPIEKTIIENNYKKINKKKEKQIIIQEGINELLEEKEKNNDR